jgi:hypothetical protein
MFDEWLRLGCESKSKDLVAFLKLERGEATQAQGEYKLGLAP